MEVKKMIKLNELNKEELKKTFASSKELKQVTRDRIIENEFYFIDEKLDIIKKGLNNYNFGLWEKCWYDITTDEEIIQNVIKEYVKNYSSSERVLELVEKNIFTEKTLKFLIQDDVLTSIQYLEDLKESDLFDEFSEFIINDLDNYFIQDEKLIKIVEV
jgi:hypothetical protein